MNRTQIYLETSQRKLLREIAKDRGTTISGLIREAIWGIISNYRKPKKDPLQEIIGLYREKTDRGGSVQHDDIYD